MDSKCVFCKIRKNELPSDKYFENDEIIVFKDIKPAAKHHFLAIPKEHIFNANSLVSKDDKELLLRLMEAGKKVLVEQGADLNDTLLGFHMPPFNSVSHLHLHVISPASQMSLLSKIIFKPNPLWFSTADAVLDKLNHKL